MRKNEAIWSVRQILFATLIAGPIGGLYLMGKNARLFGKQNAGKTYWLTALGVSACLVVLFLLMSEDILEKIPNFLPSAVIALSLTEVARNVQGERIKAYIAEKKRHSYWKLVAHALWLLPLSLAFGWVVGVVTVFLMP